MQILIQHQLWHRPANCILKIQVCEQYLKLYNCKQTSVSAPSCLIALHCRCLVVRNLSLLCDILGGNFQSNLITMLDLVLRASPPLISNYNYSRPPNTADLGTDEKAAVFGNRRYWESYITYKTLILDLEMGGGIGGRRYWEGRYCGGGL